MTRGVRACLEKRRHEQPDRRLRPRRARQRRDGSTLSRRRIRPGAERGAQTGGAPATTRDHRQQRYRTRTGSARLKALEGRFQTRSRPGGEGDYSVRFGGKERPATSSRGSTNARYPRGWSGQKLYGAGRLRVHQQHLGRHGRRRVRRSSGHPRSDRRASARAIRPRPAATCRRPADCGFGADITKPASG